MARRDRPRTLHIEDAAFGRADADRGERPRIVRYLGRHQAFDAERGVGEAIIVHDIDPVRRRRRCAGEIDVDAVIGNGQGCIEDERLVIAVHGHAVAIGALRQSTDTAERRLARGFDDGLAEPVKIGDFELVHHLDQPTTALVVARRGRVDVALHLQRLAYIGAYQAQQVIIHAPLAGKRHDRNGQALLKDLPSVRPHPQPSYVDHMDRVSEQPDGFAAIEAWCHHRDVVEMARGEPGVVGDVVVAGLHCRERIDIEKMSHRIRHRIHVPRGAGDRLRQHAAVAVEHAGRKVARLAHGSAERSPQHGLRLLFHHGNEPAPHDLGVDLRERGVGASDHDQASLRMSSI